MRTSMMGVVVLGVAMLTGCFHDRAAEPDSKSTGITTVVYSLDPFRTFQISGTDVKGLTLAELKGALHRHQKTHPDAAYEVLAEVKNVPESEKEIIDVFKAAGVKLLHYWAPVSAIDPNSIPGKYGVGHVDVLK